MIQPKLIDLPEQRHTAFANPANIFVIQPKLNSDFARAAASCFTKANTVTEDLFTQQWARPITGHMAWPLTTKTQGMALIVG